MITTLSYVSMFLISITFAVSLIIVVLVLKDKFQHKNDEETYNKTRIYSIYAAVIAGYIGSIINHSINFHNNELQLSTFSINIFFYVSMAIIITLLTFKKSTGVNQVTLQTEDYHAVQFIIVLISGFAPLLLIR